MPLRTPACLVREALEALGVSHVFSTPGAQYQHLHEALSLSELVTTVLVGHEAAVVSMAEGVSRTGASLGTLLIDTSAGLTPAFPGLAQAWVDGIALLAISCRHERHVLPSAQCGRPDLLQSVTKGQWRVQRHADVIPMLYQAVRLARSGKPGPVWVELDLPATLGRADATPAWTGTVQPLAVTQPSNTAVLPVTCLAQARGKKDAQSPHRPGHEAHVSPAGFFLALQVMLPGSARTVFDDPRLARLPTQTEDHLRRLASAVHVSGKGYGIPAAMGTKFVQPDSPVVALVGEAGLRMTALELITAVDHNLGLVVFVLTQPVALALHLDLDGPGQSLSALALEGVAQATGAAFLRLQHDAKVEPIMAQALSLAQGGTVVLVEVAMDCSAALGHEQISLHRNRPSARRPGTQATSNTVTLISSRRRRAS